MDTTSPNSQPTGRRTPLPHACPIKADWQALPTPRVDRRTLLEAADQAGRALKLPCGAKALLGVLASTYGEQRLAQGLLVWPSNEYLMAKTGLPERTLRHAIMRLRHEGLLRMVDSPNGKRFARRKGDAVTEAFGFDLSPLYVRRMEFATLAAELEAEAKLCGILRHDISAARKDIEDIIEGLGRLARQDLAGPLAQALADKRTPRSKFVKSNDFQVLLVEVETLRERAERMYYAASKPANLAGCGGQIGRHIESNTDFSIENCKEIIMRRDANASQTPPFSAAGGSIWAFRKKEGSDSVQYTEHCDPAKAEKMENGRAGALPPESENSEEWRNAPTERNNRNTDLIDVDLWRSACPTFNDFGPVTSMQDVAATGYTMSRLLQVAQHGLDRWKKALGPALFPLVAAYVYQVYADDQARPRPEIRKPGGFFCYVAKEVAEGQRDLSIDLMALRRKRRTHPGKDADKWLAGEAAGM